MDREADRAIPRPPLLENRALGRILDNRRVPSSLRRRQRSFRAEGCSRGRVCVVAD
jgi:hypothetical protein